MSVRWKDGLLVNFIRKVNDKDIVICAIDSFLYWG